MPNWSQPPFEDKEGSALIEAVRHDSEKVFIDLNKPSPNLQANMGTFEFIPDMDVQMSNDSLSISVELAGVALENIEVMLMDNHITVSGEKKAEIRGTSLDQFYGERRYGTFFRAVSLPFQANVNNIVASLERGVLYIVIEKPPGSSPVTQKIVVQPTRGGP